MSLSTEIVNLHYRRERATGNLLATFNGSDVVLVANRSGAAFGHTNITSYGAMVDGRKVGNAGTLNDARIFAGLELLDMFTDDVETPDCSPAGEPC